MKLHLAAGFVIGLALSVCASTAGASIFGHASKKAGQFISKRTDPSPALIRKHQLPEAGTPNGPIGKKPWDVNLPKTRSPIEVLFSHESQNEPKRRELLQSISRTFKTVPRFVRATPDSRDFGISFRLGAREGEARLRKVSPNLQSLTSAWLNAGQYQRVFVIGVSESDEDAKALKNSLAEDGYQVFFYKFCESAIGQLCSAEEVGAFFATAGHVVAFKAPSLKRSDYVNVEIASAYSHRTGGLLLVFTPEQLRKYLIGSTAVPFGAAASEIDSSDSRRRNDARTNGRAAPVLKDTSSGSKRTRFPPQH